MKVGNGYMGVYYIILSTFVFKICHNKKFKNIHLEM